ncbi:ABC transporter ATP-binding protein [Helicobacter cetorum]|uniref:Cell division transport system ATP-binding protein n=1 Tax=Helicobacter cetorum (strain ATCC BAA-540 / CCUG 52418 / MIT 99-5656) TaxID=1163745 RepID=I0ETV1_HELCM|nr:ABC transporter ATP-binding protein [Helicobacter cetorum]AFI06370.1 cell division transport system ATP-binding protein [Helicobacter cetorum MIT 99-5656]
MSVIISASNLCLQYERNEPVIKHANLRIKRKDFVFISGPSGSGKSTLLRSFYGDLKLSSGDLEVCNINMNNASKTTILDLRKNIGVVFQDYKLIQNYTIEENIRLPMIICGIKREESNMQLEKLLGHIDLRHKANRYPRELSGGEQQRVAMARAMANCPELILADEPTGNLDPYSSDKIWSLLRGMNTQLNATVVVVTHKFPKNFSAYHRKFYIEDGEVYEYS